MPIAKKSTLPDNTKNKMHPWRHCPVGKHYVREHSRHIPPSKEHLTCCTHSNLHRPDFLSTYFLDN